MKTKSIVSIATLAKRALGIFQESKVALRSTLGAAGAVLRIPGRKRQSGRGGHQHGSSQKRTRPDGRGHEGIHDYSEFTGF